MYFRGHHGHFTRNEKHTTKQTTILNLGQSKTLEEA